jgi:hypothetical protein
MPVRTITVYEVNTSYVSSGATSPVLTVSTLTFNDDDDFLDRSAGADSGTLQSLTSSLGTVSGYTFVYDDSSDIYDNATDNTGTTMDIKTFYMTIDGVQRAFIIDDTGEDIPGLVVGGSVDLLGYVAYTPIEYDDIPCFASGTWIDTPTGKVLVEDLKEGDAVSTRDSGVQIVRWAGSVSLSFRDLLADRDLAPICIAANALGKGMPSSDLFLSPQHRILISGWEVELAFGDDEALAPAKYLLGQKGVSQPARDCGITYHHLLFDKHEIILSNDLATESFLAGDTLRDESSAETQLENAKLFPDLSRKTEIETARPVLRKYETDTVFSLR